MESPPKRVPVPRDKNKSCDRSASTPPPMPENVGTDTLTDGLIHSEPGSPQRRALKQDILPLEEIKRMVHKILDKVEQDLKKKETKRHKSAASRRQKRQQRAETREQERRAKEEAKERWRAFVDSKRDDAKAILAAVDAEIEATKALRYPPWKETIVRYTTEERRILERMLDEGLVYHEISQEVRESITGALNQLSRELEEDKEAFVGVLRSMHARRIVLISHVFFSLDSCDDFEGS
ncbi:hypothetical protein HIM_08381 [Hirsutella minnesotensis 3608]|uniref:Uncharacterized protein n=1 Tax=Hirsutella minnesotensis 3608 TaxID=1043627 RepID=A0A0F8A3Q5_9HYPO|nr:hypothetical protein HIM_08381 [Hirsutella minnesotensis 3608]